MAAISIQLLLTKRDLRGWPRGVWTFLLGKETKLFGKIMQNLSNFILFYLVRFLSLSNCIENWIFLEKNLCKLAIFQKKRLYKSFFLWNEAVPVRSTFKMAPPVSDGPPDQLLNGLPCIGWTARSTFGRKKFLIP